MEPAVVSVIIKSDRLRKRFPRVGEMVRMEERKGLFRVMRVDLEQRAADLTQRVGLHESTEANVPFRLIQSVPQNTSRAIAQFLQS